MQPNASDMARWRKEGGWWELTHALVADVSPISRKRLQSLFQQMGDVVIVGEARSEAEVIMLAEQLVPDVLLFNPTGFKATDPIDLIRAVLQEHPHIGIVLLLATENVELIGRALRAGACGYVLDGSAPRSLRTRVKAAHRGEVVLSRPMARAVLDPTAVGAAPGGLVSGKLSQRERELLQVAAQGLGNKGIASALQLSEKTVRNHLSSIFSKLGVHDRTQAVLVGLREGLVTLSEEPGRARAQSGSGTGHGRFQNGHGPRNR